VLWPAPSAKRGERPGAGHSEIRGIDVLRISRATTPRRRSSFNALTPKEWSATAFQKIGSDLRSPMRSSATPIKLTTHATSAGGTYAGKALVHVPETDRKGYGAPNVVPDNRAITACRNRSSWKSRRSGSWAKNTTHANDAAVSLMLGRNKVIPAVSRM